MTEAFSYSLSKDGEYYAVTGACRKGIEEIEIPAAHKGKPVREIGAKAFYMCKNLRRVRLPPDIRCIGDSAFSCCYALAEILLPNGVEQIGEGAFSYCEGLSNIAIEGRGTCVGGAAFYGCGGLEIVCIGEGVNCIGEEAFGGCKRLKEVIFSSPEGWDAEGVSLGEALSNRTLAAQYLTASYYGCRRWRRS